MIAKAAPARNVVRGFQTPVTSGDEDSDFGGATPRLSATDATTYKVLRRPFELDGPNSGQVDSSPESSAAPSPSISGIGLLRLQMDPLSLDSAATSRASSMIRTDSRSKFASPLSKALSAAQGSRAHSRGGSGDDSDRSGDVEIDLDDDFVSESAPDRSMAQEGQSQVLKALEGGLVPRKKMAAEDFEPLRCLGKGTYGTVLLVKQHTTGRLFAQKQFKKASLVVHKKLVEQTKTERQILESINKHPFVVSLFYAFQDREKLYLILEYGQGGELFTHLDQAKMFPEPTAAFYLAEMVLALSYLHDNLGVVYRDLKPENILLDAEGHLLLTDFGLSKVAADDATCKSMLGTVEYMAPEVILGQKYGKAVDWWSLGALAHDLLTGSPPFTGANNKKIQEKIVNSKLKLPFFISDDAKDLLTRFLRKDPRKRLGSHMPKDLATIKKHRFFRHVNWVKLERRELEAPIKPLITDPELAENFSEDFTSLSLSPVQTRNYMPTCGSASASASAMGMGISAATAVVSSSSSTSSMMGSSLGRAEDDIFKDFSYHASSSLLERGGFVLAGQV